MALQTILPIRADKYCVLLTCAGVRTVLADFDLDNDGVIEACEEHWLAPAFDIGMEGRRDLRILPSAVKFFDATGGSRTRRMTLAEMFAEVLRGRPCPEGWISGESARAILNCEGGHINGLVDEGWLETVPGWKRRCGPGGSDRITLASFKAFLQGRLV